PAQEKKERRTSSNIEEMDFTWIEQSLLQQMIPARHVLTGANRRLIIQMIELYDLAQYEIEKSLMWALNEDNTLNRNEFKEACHDLFLSKKQTSDIKLTDKKDTAPQTYANYKPTTKEEQLINNFEKSTPKE